MFAAVISVSAFVSIPMPYGVPMTMQTLAVPLAGIVIGPRLGAGAAILYVLIGAAGLPVFAGFTGGIGAVVGMRGGFIVSFPIMACLAGIGANAKKNRTVWTAMGLAAGTAANFLCGMLMYSLVTGNSPQASFAACVAPFLPTAAIKAALAYTLGVRVKGAITN